MSPELAALLRGVRPLEFDDDFGEFGGHARAQRAILTLRLRDELGLSAASAEKVAHRTVVRALMEVAHGASVDEVARALKCSRATLERDAALIGRLRTAARCD